MTVPENVQGPLTEIRLKPVAPVRVPSWWSISTMPGWPGMERGVPKGVTPLVDQEPMPGARLVEAWTAQDRSVAPVRMREVRTGGATSRRSTGWSNGASGTNYGAEIELDVQASDQLQLFASVGLLETEI